jgi:hypothetical protein
MKSSKNEFLESNCTDGPALFPGVGWVTTVYSVRNSPFSPSFVDTGSQRVAVYTLWWPSLRPTSFGSGLVRLRILRTSEDGIALIKLKFLRGCKTDVN